MLDGDSFSDGHVFGDFSDFECSNDIAFAMLKQIQNDADHVYVDLDHSVLEQSITCGNYSKRSARPAASAGTASPSLCPDSLECAPQSMHSSALDEPMSEDLAVFDRVLHAMVGPIP